MTKRVADPARELGRERLRRRDRDRRRLVGQRVEPRVLDRVVRAAVRLVAALPEQAHHLDRLLEHLEPLVRRRPARAGDVLVQVLARADAEEEAAGISAADVAAAWATIAGCVRISRAGDAGAEPEALRRRARSPPITLQTNGLWPWRVDPRVEVVGDHREREARLLGPRRVARPGRAGRAPRDESQ